MIAIESAVAGGSISLFRDDVEIDNWIGSASVSKAEDLLFNIDFILKKNSISRSEIKLIAVSAGPGSFTGIRIGIATALGLRAGLGIEMSSESALKAMVLSYAHDGLIHTAVPVGRGSVCTQSFMVSRGALRALDEPTAISEEALTLIVNDSYSGTILLHELLYEKVQLAPNTVNFGSNLANAIGNVCKSTPGIVVEPLFISKSL